jgi:TRAP-type C4-dicarboxylate transport system substrate-binding protein
MRKFWITSIALLMLFALLACGGAEEPVEEDTSAEEPTAAAAAPTAAPSPTDTPVPATEAASTAQEPTPVKAAQEERTEAEEEPETPAVSAALQAYADANEGGPGAIYVGDLNQMVGPAATVEQGDFDGNVTLSALENHLYVFESDYYKGLLEQANVENPTQLVERDEVFTIQHACLNRALSFCRVIETFYFPKVIERTNGQVDFVMSSFPELGLGGPDIPNLLAAGTLDAGSVVGPYVAGQVPALEIQYLFGLFTERQQQYFTTAAIAPEVEALLEESTGGGKLIVKEWAAGNDFFFFSKKPLLTPEDFEGVKTRAFGTSISDWIIGMGADPQFVAFAEVYTALERGILGAGVTGGDAGFGQRWYEVADYLSGPLTSWPANDMVMNKDKWEELPPDLQAIVLEEAAKAEMEMLRLGAIQNEMGLRKLIEKGGMEFTEFSPELRAKSDKAVVERVIPNWADRVGLDSPWIDVFNEKFSPIVGYEILEDGTAIKVPKEQ